MGGVGRHFAPEPLVVWDPRVLRTDRRWLHCLQRKARFVPHDGRLGNAVDAGVAF